MKRFIFIFFLTCLGVISYAQTTTIARLDSTGVDDSKWVRYETKYYNVDGVLYKTELSNNGAWESYGDALTRAYKTAYEASLVEVPALRRLTTVPEANQVFNFSNQEIQLLTYDSVTQTSNTYYDLIQDPPSGPATLESVMRFQNVSADSSQEVNSNVNGVFVITNPFSFKGTSFDITSTNEDYFIDEQINNDNILRGTIKRVSDSTIVDTTLLVDWNISLRHKVLRIVADTTDALILVIPSGVAREITGLFDFTPITDGERFTIRARTVESFEIRETSLTGTKLFDGAWIKSFVKHGSRYSLDPTAILLNNGVRLKRTLWQEALTGYRIIFFNTTL